MDTAASPAVRTGYAARREVVVAFSAADLRAPFMLRCAAALIDYIVLIAVPVFSFILSKFSGSAATPGAVSLGSTGVLLTVLVFISNFILLPMLNGQSAGKMLTGLRIVKTDGTAASNGSILLRNLIGYPLSILTFGLGFLISVLNAKGRALHDLISGTVVVYADRKIR
jgi:uncharacterized RDD family membrane protein YckC